jgi:hypothetical protein
MAIGKADIARGDMTFEIAIGDGRSDGAGNDALYLVWDDGRTVTNLSPARPSFSLRDNQWHMVTATYASGAQRLYVDGCLVASGATGGPLPIVANSVKIGGVNGFGPYHHPWVGQIDEVSVYGRVLTASEVLGLFTAYRVSIGC